MKSIYVMTAIMALLLTLSLSPAVSAQTKGWGLNASGQLGIGNRVSPQLDPIVIPEVPDATAMDGFYQHTLFLKANGTVMAAGANSAGEQGNGLVQSTTMQTTPGPVINLTRIVQVAAGWSHSAALRDDGTVWVWGSNQVGQAGNGTISTNECQCVAVPTQASISDVVQIQSGSRHILALKSDGTVWAWGRNASGELGIGTSVFDPVHATPVQVGVGVAGFNNIIVVAGGEYHSAALKADGTVWVWGNNNRAQVGNGAFAPNVPGCRCEVWPVKNTTLENITQITAGGEYNVAVDTNGRVWTWGGGHAGNGQIDWPACFCILTPEQNTTLTRVVDAKAVGYSTMVRRQDGSVWVYGDNAFGQVGNGTPDNLQATPTQSNVGEGNAVIGSDFFSSFASNPRFITPVGTNLRQYGKSINFTFPSITSEGTTEYTGIDPTTTGLTLPAGYDIPENTPAYQISSTAGSGTSRVCLSVPAEFDAAQFARLKVLHEEGTGLVDRTVSSSFIKREICADVGSLSRFVVARSTVSTANITGRVLDTNGNAILNASVTMTDSQGQRLTARTNGFGYFTFDSVAAFATYTFTASAKRFRFDPQVVTVNGDLNDLNFTPRLGGEKGNLIVLDPTPRVEAEKGSVIFLDPTPRDSHKSRSVIHFFSSEGFAGPFGFSK